MRSGLVGNPCKESRKAFRGRERTVPGKQFEILAATEKIRFNL